MNKYYTPTIDEFHVGFRYQNKYTAGLWQPNIFLSRDILPDNKAFEDGNIRVKCLDEDDIEEFSWERCPEKDSLETLAFTLGDGFHTLHFGKEDGYVAIVYEWGEKFKGTIWGKLNNSETLFIGNCNNYNELKFIMNRLNLI